MSSSCLNTEELTSLFNNILLLHLGLFVVNQKLNGTTRAVRHECRRAECQWKKDRLQVSFDILKDS